MLQHSCRKDPTSGGSRQQSKEARTREAGFFQQIVLRERRYADLGHLLPLFHIELAVEPGVSALTRG